jgi:hypothetical protein
MSRTCRGGQAEKDPAEELAALLAFVNNFVANLPETARLQLCRDATVEEVHAGRVGAGTIQYCTVQQNAIQYNTLHTTVQYSIQYNTLYIT